MLRVTIDMLGAEGGSLYIYDDIHDKLKIVLMLNDKLGVNSAVRDFDPLQIKGIIEVPLFDESGRPFDKAVSVHSFLLRETVTVSDVYAENETYDFANVRKFDSENNYRTDRIMAVPLIGHNDRSIGVMQIINPGRRADGRRRFALCRDDVGADGSRARQRDFGERVAQFAGGVREYDWLGDR